MLKAGELEERVGDPRFATRKQRSDRHDDIVKMLRQAFAKKPRDYWLARLDAHSIPNAPINTIHEVFDNPQIKHLGIPKQIEHPQMGVSNLVGSPDRTSRGTPPKFFRAAPLLGENTAEVLAKLGYDSDAVKELKTSGVI